MDAVNKQQNERDAQRAEFELQQDIRQSRIAIRDRVAAALVAEANPFDAAEFADNSSPEALLNDPCTPFWAADVIRVALTKDCVDAANVFAVLAQSFDARAKKLLGQ
jgi:hypothetical protein